MIGIDLGSQKPDVDGFKEKKRSKDGFGINQPIRYDAYVIDFKSISNPNTNFLNSLIFIILSQYNVMLVVFEFVTIHNQR